MIRWAPLSWDRKVLGLSVMGLLMWHEGEPIVAVIFIVSAAIIAFKRISGETKYEALKCRYI